MDKDFIETIIKSFASEGRIFENEVQFQFGFAWRLREFLGDNVFILVEHRLSDKKDYTDLVVGTSDGMTAIEFKYRLADKSIIYKNHNNEITTSAQGAPDIGCYGFLKDVERLEKNKESSIITQGYAIMITNYPLIWGDGTRKGTNWELMCLRNKNTVGPGKIEWKKNPPRDDYKEAIELSNGYEIEWKDYKMNSVEEILDNGRIKHPFKYLVIEV